MISKNKKYLSAKYFAFFTINFVVGFGFIATIFNVLEKKVYGFVVLAAASFIAFGVLLVFSRLSDTYKETYGGSYAYSKDLMYEIDSKGNRVLGTKKSHQVYKHLTFFTGWTQFIQGPILSATSPIFLVAILEPFFRNSDGTSNEVTINIIRGVSFLVYIILILITTFGLRINRWVVLAAASVKWLILLFSLILGVYLIAQGNIYSSNLTLTKSDEEKISFYLVISSVLTFMYAYGGIEGVSAISKDVKAKSFRKILMYSFVFIFVFYVVFYLILLGIKTEYNGQKIDQIRNIFSAVWGLSGAVFFAVGIFFQQVSSKISGTVTIARSVAPMAEDKFLPVSLAKTNSKNEFKNAIWFSTAITIFSLVIFYVIPLVLKANGYEEPSSYLSQVVNIGTIPFLVQYLLTFIIAFILEHKKRITKIPLWEKIIYVLASIAIIVVLAVYIFPVIANERWSASNTITLVSYSGFTLLGYVFYFATRKYYKNKKLKNN